MTSRLPHPRRSDALDNRELILAAARAAFTADGLNVPMREIAQRAGVAPATLYRRFPTKQELATAVFADQVGACRAIVGEGLADPDPWHGFCLVIEKICALHARNRDFTAAFAAAFPRTADTAADREHNLRSVAELVRRARAAGRLRADFVLDDLVLARAAGRLRADFVLDDLVLMLTAQNGIRAASPVTRVTASRRFARLVIQAFQAPSGDPAEAVAS